MTGPRGAVLRKPGADWEIHELTVAAPKAGEVLVRMAYAGLCHSDEHMRFSTTTELPVTAAMVTGTFAATGKGGAVVLAGLSRDPDELTIHLPGSVLARTERRVLGCYFGSCNPVRDIPLVLSLYQRGELQLDDLISARYRLEDITAGYADLAAGRNARGLLAFMG